MSAGDEANLIIHTLQLLPHPEGGYYRRTYTAPVELHVGSGDGRETRHATSAIYYMLTEGDISALHKIDSDEMWHFYSGGPLVIVELDSQSGRSRTTLLGPDICAGQVPQHLVKGGTWFAAFLADGTKFALVGCTVTPEFRFDTFVMGDRIQLVALFPLEEATIMRLTQGKGEH
jgi:uncharacterized protein